MSAPPVDAWLSAGRRPRDTVPLPSRLTVFGLRSSGACGRSAVGCATVGVLAQVEMAVVHSEVAVLDESGNNSVVECDLAKVEVAGSNPVSRSSLRSRELFASYGWQANLAVVGAQVVTPSFPRLVRSAP